MTDNTCHSHLRFRMSLEAWFPLPSTFYPHADGWRGSKALLHPPLPLPLPWRQTVPPTHCQQWIHTMLVRKLLSLLLVSSRHSPRRHLHLASEEFIWKPGYILSSQASQWMNWKTITLYLSGHYISTPGLSFHNIECYMPHNQLQSKLL